mmetsp:Transcript_118422/g.334782  ORF Transcript_118422/g.334782 Transcript_118422/m.334782 type:complete len:97 (+) Transcript_118422:1511-1801(+)
MLVPSEARSALSVSAAPFLISVAAAVPVSVETLLQLALLPPPLVVTQVLVEGVDDEAGCATALHLDGRAGLRGRLLLSLGAGEDPMAFAAVALAPA